MEITLCTTVTLLSLCLLSLFFPLKSTVFSDTFRYFSSVVFLNVRIDGRVGGVGLCKRYTIVEILSELDPRGVKQTGESGENDKGQIVGKMTLAVNQIGLSPVKLSELGLLVT